MAVTVKAGRPAWVNDPEPPWYYVQSSNVKAIRYHPAARQIEVWFLNEHRYYYANCHRFLFSSFLVAGSKGKFVWRNLRDRPDHPCDGPYA